MAYARAPRLFEELRIAHGDGSFGKRLSALAKTDLLILDDWALARSIRPSATICWRCLMTAWAPAPR